MNSRASTKETGGALTGSLPSISRRGLLFVLSSPSGAGKTTLSRRLLEGDDAISMSVSVTTRKPRPGEVDGIDYYFLDEAAFTEQRDSGALLEWAKVFSNYYGTPKAPVMQALIEGRDVLFDIDWQGAQQLAESVGNDLVRVFILPPSVKTLEERLKKRNQDAADVVAARMAESASEISHWGEYDYVLINHEVEDTLAQLRAILAAERLRRERQVGLVPFAKELLEEL